MFSLVRLCIFSLLFLAGPLFAATVQDERGRFTLDKTPQRIVVLELSFVDALAAVDVSPTGVADDNDPSRILADVRARLKPWQSVGTRAQPSLEAISALHPDLIVADSSRHAGIYAALRQIAPVLLLKSRNETWEENLQSAAIIGKVVGKDKEMQQRLALHRQKMAAFSRQLPAGASVLFGTSREQQFNLHSTQTYTGSVLTALGLKVPPPIGGARGPPRPGGGAPMAAINFEQLLALNPQWLLVAHYRTESIVKKWQQDSLWPMLQAEQKGQVAAVDSNSWARMRGIFAAERIASDMVKIVHHRAVDITP